MTTTKDCGPESNLDLVHFCWDHAERFSSIKHALLIIPKFIYMLPFGVSPTRTACLRYYRSGSDGRRDEVNCTACTRQYQAALRHMLNCQLPVACLCNVCLRQPPSLQGAASHVLFRQAYTICNSFRLRSSTTFNEYVYAVRSGRVDEERLLPPEFPNLRIRCASDTAHTRYHNITCPGHGVWNNVMMTRFRTREGAIKTLSSWFHRFWCSHCSRGCSFRRHAPNIIETSGGCSFYTHTQCIRLTLRIYFRNGSTTTGYR